MQIPLPIKRLFKVEATSALGGHSGTTGLAAAREAARAAAGPKFKRGDRVVLLPESGPLWPMRGKQAMITRVATRGVYVIVIVGEAQEHYCPEHWLEFASETHASP